VWSKTFVLASVSREILYESADLCAVHKSEVGRKLGLLDAIHLATAIRARCQYFVSADKAIMPPVGMARIGFDAHAIDAIRKALA
jgi:predicted nucleic acid-binding protein